MLSSAGVAPLPPCFHKLLRETVTTFAVFPCGCTFSMVTTIACCPCHFVRVTSTLAEWRNLPGDGCRCFYDAQLRTVVFSQRRMISFLLCLAVLPTCSLLHDSRLLGLALRPSAPVCCCHRVSWARGRLAFAQEAVRCPPSFLLDCFCIWWHMPGGFRQPVCNFSSDGVEM